MSDIGSIETFDPSKVKTPNLDREKGLGIVEFPGGHPYRLTVPDFKHFLVAAVMAGASDITIQSEEMPKYDVHGIKYVGTNGRRWGVSEVFEILAEVYGGANLQSEIYGQKIIDTSYEVPRPDGYRQRFRVNITGIAGRSQHGVEATFRALPVITPTLEKVGLSMDMVHAMTPLDGMVLIGGSTGSGKSTTMAALNGYSFTNTDRSVKIVDLQAPIEYSFLDLRDVNPRSIIGQSEVGKHIVSFEAGVRSALRRNPDIITVGEARDRETIAAALDASLTGHAVYTTTHANSVAEAISRMRSSFSAEEQAVRSLDLLTTLRFVMVQYLIPRIDINGRIAVREFLRITDRIRKKLLNTEPSRWGLVLNDEIDGKTEGSTEAGELRQSLVEESIKLYNEGKISKLDAQRLVTARKNSVSTG